MADAPSIIVVRSEEQGTDDVAKRKVSTTDPQQGILKKRDRKMKPEERDKRMSSGVQWDEMNILMTEHPPGKDYGHMKIEEPKTPFHEMVEDEEEDETTATISSDDITQRVLSASVAKPQSFEKDSDSSGEELTEEAKEKKRKFQEWRKAHYNEYQAVQRARELMKEDEEELRKLEEAEKAGLT